MVDENTLIKWICESPKGTYEVLAELRSEGVSISYPTLMHRLGLLVATKEIKKIRTMDKRTIYHTVPTQLNKQEVKS